MYVNSITLPYCQGVLGPLCVKKCRGDAGGDVLKKAAFSGLKIYINQHYYYYYCCGCF